MILQRVFDKATGGRLFALAGVFFLQGCVATSATLGADDPLEPMNRAMFAFNTTVTRTVAAPFLYAYNVPTLAPAREALTNVMVNLRAPLVFANDLAQGNECAAGATLRRFMVNSTLGIGGLIDVARMNGIEAHDNDFGLTLGAWGIGEGPYLVLPLLGPSSLRDALGQGVEYFADPVDIALERSGMHSLVYVRAGVDEFIDYADSEPALMKIERTSLDPYAAARSAYRQYIARQLRNSNCPRILRTAEEKTN